MLSKRLIGSVFVLMLVLAACSPAPAPATKPPTKAAAPTEAPAATSMPDQPAVPFPTGRFEGKGEAVQYNPDGTFEFYTSASKIDPVLIGNYTVEGNLITAVDPNETDPNCKEAVAYQWTYENNTLTFKPTGDDACKGRSEANAEAYVLNAKYLPEISVTAQDYSYIAPVSVRSGWTRVILTNKGTEVHHVQFLRLNDGVTIEQFQAALEQAEGPALAMTKQVGGVGAVAPGMTAQAVINLEPGNYAILCLIPSPSDHVAHHTKGMVKALTVQDASGHGVEPASDLSVNLKDFLFEMPETLGAGPLSVMVSNDGPEAHEFNILKLADGKTLNDVTQFLSGAAGGPPPFTPVGGMNGLEPGAMAYAELNLQPGHYVAICNIPSPKAEGHPHFTLGMIREFTIGTSSASAAFPTGTFTDAKDKLRGYIFNPDMTWEYFTLGTGTISASSTYSLEGHLWTDQGIVGQCPAGTYEWDFDGSNLSFNAVGVDDCPDRKASLDGHTFVLQQ